MISQETVWKEIWPVVETLIQATVAEDPEAIGRLLAPNEQAAEMLDLFGFAVFDILLKTVLGREQLGVTRAVETENGRYVHVEYAWPEPGQKDNSYTAADVVAVRLEQVEGAWRVVEINPASADLPLTGGRARGILASSKALSEKDKVPAEPWILPVALYGGLLQIPVQATAMDDAVEELLLPGLQHRTYGVMSLLRGRRLWRDFKAAAQPHLGQPAGWAAAVEFIVSEQNMRSQTQAAAAKNYKVNLSTLVPRVRQIKKMLNIQGLDERYTDLQTTQIVYTDQGDERVKR